MADIKVNIARYLTRDLSRDNRMGKQKTRSQILHERNKEKYGDKLRRMR